METRKIALIIAGGVSLGSYEAGVLTELLYALEVLNQKAEKKGTPHFVIDVMTGASAGGMTAALVARHMMFEGDKPIRNLHQAWVESVDIQNLMEETPENALFSKKALLNLATNYLIGDIAQKQIQRASYAPEVLRMRFMLSNMHGIDWEIPYLIQSSKRKESFMTTFFSDDRTFTLTNANLENIALWEEIKETVIAGGNFPIAFQPHQLFRKVSDYNDSKQAKEGYFGEGRKLAFIDGGLFNNEPLRDAIELAADADGGTIDDNRIFILIDPNVNKSAHMKEVDVVHGSLLEHAKQLFRMVGGESVARDWLRANRTNIELLWRDEWVKIFSELLKVTEFEAEVTQPLRTLAERIIEDKRKLKGSSDYPPSYLSKSLASIAKQHPKEFSQLKTESAAVAELFLIFVFVMNNIAGLQNKSNIKIRLISADSETTAGDILFGFGGFFEKKWRQHDFIQGRKKAHEILPAILEVHDYPPDASNRSDYEMPAEWKNYPQETIKNASRSSRLLFRNLLLRRVRGTLKEANFMHNWVMTLLWWAFLKRVVKKKINALLEL